VSGFADLVMKRVDLAICELHSVALAPLILDRVVDLGATLKGRYFFDKWDSLRSGFPKLSRQPREFFSVGEVSKAPETGPTATVAKVRKYIRIPWNCVEGVLVSDPIKHTRVELHYPGGRLRLEVGADIIQYIS
jgi:hypothetical protein